MPKNYYDDGEFEKILYGTDGAPGLRDMKKKYPGWTGPEILKKVNEVPRENDWIFDNDLPLSEKLMKVNSDLAGSAGVAEGLRAGVGVVPPAKKKDFSDYLPDFLKSEPGGAMQEQKQMKGIPEGDVGQSEVNGPLAALMKFLGRK